jgi:hypothetical protein
LFETNFFLFFLSKGIEILVNTLEKGTMFVHFLVSTDVC